MLVNNFMLVIKIKEEELKYFKYENRFTMELRVKNKRELNILYC